jgi:hypothetical protein
LPPHRGRRFFSRLSRQPHARGRRAAPPQRLIATPADYAAPSNSPHGAAVIRAGDSLLLQHAWCAACGCMTDLMERALALLGDVRPALLNRPVLSSTAPRSHASPRIETLSPPTPGRHVQCRPRLLLRLRHGAAPARDVRGCAELDACRRRLRHRCARGHAVSDVARVTVPVDSVCVV